VPVGFQQIKPTDEFANVFRTVKNYKHASPPVYGKVQAGREQSRSQISLSYRRFPFLIFRSRVREPPPPLKKIEELYALAKSLNFAIRGQHKTYVAAAKCRLAMSSIAARGGNRKVHFAEGFGPFFYVHYFHHIASLVYHGYRSQSVADSVEASNGGKFA
jgi:hypothetical protein